MSRILQMQIDAAPGLPSGTTILVYVDVPRWTTHQRRRTTMTKRELAQRYLYDLHNVADHVDMCAQIAQHDLEYSPARALDALRNVRTSAGRIEMHLDEAIRALEALVADPDQPDHPGAP